MLRKNGELEKSEKGLCKVNRKKKGFTLVELIAVIAILGILAAIIVPRIANYTGKATTAKHLANAKTLSQAIEAYNAENNGAISTTTDITTSDIQGKLKPTYIGTWPNDMDVITAAQGTGYSGAANTYQALLDYIDKNSGSTSATK